MKSHAVDQNKTAIISPSYNRDFQRCQLLCDSIDRFVSEPVDHYILVDDHDYRLFASLAGSKRHIINENDILPTWFKSVRPGLSENTRKIWYSTRTWPLRGWHVQQLRRIAIAGHISHDGLLYCDSDMLFIKPFSTRSLWRDGALRLYRKDCGIHDALPASGRLHKAWTRHAAWLNGLDEPTFPAEDYINNMVSWRRDHVLSLCRNVEAQTSKHWLAAIASKRSFSECQIYGAYVDGVLGGSGHWHGEGALCQTYWNGQALSKDSVTTLIESMEADQVAIGVQSFTGTDTQLLRNLIAA